MSRFAQRPALASGQTRPGRSLYEDRYKARKRRERWEPVGELDSRTGEWLTVEEGWGNRVRGWMPLGEFLEQRR
jgi:hypothetical protein